MNKVTLHGKTLQLVQGDITNLDADAIVNAANTALQLGSGVAGAIARKGGSSIQRECDGIGHCPEGGAVLTGGGDLKARHVIHAVGPRAGNPNADRLLASACRASLEVATAHNLKTIALPAISTGVFGFPVERAAYQLLHTTIEYLSSESTSLELVSFCLYTQSDYDIFLAELNRLQSSQSQA